MKTTADLLQHAARFGALGHEARLAIVRLLLAAHPSGMVVGELQDELDIPGSTLSHHLEALRQQGLVESEREQKFQRYRAGTTALRDLLAFLTAECCTRNAVVPVTEVRLGRPSRQRRPSRRKGP